jgi:hypothetical protein
VRSTTSLRDVTFERPMTGPDLVAFHGWSGACRQRSR